MSALEEICARLALLKKPSRGAERAILVGISAERSICTRQQCPELPETILGVLVLRTLEFEGWAIRDCLKSGRWVEAEPRT